MKIKLARMLRKWADLIDPRVKPTDVGVVTVRIEADTSDYMKAIERAIAATDALKERVPVGHVRSTVTGQVQRQEWPAKAE